MSREPRTSQPARRLGAVPGPPAGRLRAARGLRDPGGALPFGGEDGFVVPGGSGSGVIIGSDGLIITNGHVVGDATDVTVILDDGTVLDGEVTGVDTLTDFAFVRVEAQDLPAVELGDSSGLRVGQMAISRGQPAGDLPGQRCGRHRQRP